MQPTIKARARFTCILNNQFDLEVLTRGSNIQNNLLEHFAMDTEVIK